MGYRPEYMILDEVAQAYGARPEHKCPDCESNWDQSSEDECPMCGLSVDDLRVRLARKVGA